MATINSTQNKKCKNLKALRGLKETGNIYTRKKEMAQCNSCLTQIFVCRWAMGTVGKILKEIQPSWLGYGTEFGRVVLDLGSKTEEWSL